MDNVNQPKHYTQGKVECIDAIESATVNKKGIEAVCVANVIKYLWRYEEKNGIEDVRKAMWYLKRLEAHISTKGRAVIVTEGSREEAEKIREVVSKLLEDRPRIVMQGGAGMP